MSFAKLTASVQASTAELDRFDASAGAVTERVREIEVARNARRGEGIQALLDGPATGGAMSLYIDTLRADPNYGGLSQIENFLRQWGHVDDSIFMMLRAAARKAHRAKNRDRSMRGQPISEDDMNRIIDEVSGR